MRWQSFPEQPVPVLLADMHQDEEEVDELQQGTLAFLTPPDSAHDFFGQLPAKLLVCRCYVDLAGSALADIHNNSGWLLSTFVLHCWVHVCSMPNRM